MIEENPLKTKILPIALIGGGLVALFILLTKRAEAGEFPCPYCDKTFASLAELNAHIASAHPGEKPYEPVEMKWCEKEGKKIPKTEWTSSRCEKYPTTYCKKEHKFIFKDEYSPTRCYVDPKYKCWCWVCDKWFTTASECNAHLKTAHPELGDKPKPCKCLIK